MRAQRTQVGYYSYLAVGKERAKYHRRQDGHLRSLGNKTGTVAVTNPGQRHRLEAGPGAGLQRASQLNKA